MEPATENHVRAAWRRVTGLAFGPYPIADTRSEMKSIMCGLGGLVMGVVGTLVWHSMQMRQAEVKESSLRVEAAEAAEVRKEVEQLRQADAERIEGARAREAEKTSLQQEVARLRGQMGAILRAQTANSATSSISQVGASSDNTGSQPARAGAANAISSWLKSATAEQMNAQFARARERLNLTPEQEQQLRGVVDQALGEGQENLQKLLTGKAKLADLPSSLEWSRSLEQQLLAGLTPEQQTAYLTHKREDISANARLMANGELLKVQNKLGLSREQQDQMFAVLYEQSVSQMDPDPASPAYTQSRNPLAVAEWQTEQRLKSVENILTPAQMESYRTMQEGNLKAMRAIFSWIK